MQILQINGDTALCSAGEVQRQVNIYLVKNQPLTVGDFLLVHIGFAIEKIDPEQAQYNLALINEAKNA